MPLKFSRFLFVICSVVACRAYAENQPSLSLDETRALALDRSPLVKAIDGEFSRQLGEALEIKLLPNPELDAEVGVPTRWQSQRGDVEIGATLSQPLRLSYFGHRQAVSILLGKAASSEQKLSLFKLLKEVDLAYMRLWALQEQKRILGEAKNVAEARIRKISDGLRSGLFSRADEALFEGEKNKIEAELLGVSGEHHAALAALIKLVGVSIGNRKLSRPPFPAHLSTEEILRAEKENPIGATQRAELLTDLSLSQERLARKDAFPEFSPKLLFSHSNEGVSFFGAGISIPLPFSNRNQPQILQREGELRAAKANRDYIDGEGFRAELSSLVDAVNLILEQARVYETKVIPSFQASLNFQAQQFETGTGSVPQIWQIQRELYETRAKDLELWIKAFGAQTELEILVGQEVR